MITTDQQKQIIDAIKAATHGQPKFEKRRMQELMLAGACIALQQEAPAPWKSLLMVGRGYKLFSR